MTKTITINEWKPVDEDKRLGYLAEISECDHIVDYDCDVVLPNGEKLVFRKKALPTLIERKEEAFSFFKKMARSQMNDSRGYFNFKEIIDKVDVRFTVGQLRLLSNYLRTNSKNFGEITTREELESFVYKSPEEDAKASKFLFMRTKVLKFFPGWGDEEGKNWWPDFVKEWEALDQEKQGELADKVWLHLKENISRGNKCPSIVMGSFDRTSRIPYARPTVLSLKHWDMYASYGDLYMEVDDTLKSALPEKWLHQRNLTNNIDPIFSMFGTAFTTMTVNHQTPGTYHRDGFNMEGSVGVLSAVTQGEYEGKELLFPEIGLAFDIRDGDFIAGNTTNLIHGNLPFRSCSEDGERVSFVWYTREGFKYADSYECEQLRKEFLDHRKKENKRMLKEEGKLHPCAKNKNWGGISKDMWSSQEWIDFKESKGMPQCSCTNYRGS